MTLREREREEDEVNRRSHGFIDKNQDVCLDHQAVTRQSFRIGLVYQVTPPRLQGIKSPPRGRRASPGQETRGTRPEIATAAANQRAGCKRRPSSLSSRAVPPRRLPSAQDALLTLFSVCCCRLELLGVIAFIFSIS